MVDRVTRLKWRRRLRRSRRQVEGIGETAEALAQRHFIRRLNRLLAVKRFLLGWFLLLGLLNAGVIAQTVGLSNYYQSLQPATGGIFTEGILGSFTTANPLYATGSVDSAVSHLLFSGLLKYDKNNQLVGDLAERWSQSPDEKTYTVTLRPDLKWHDGEPLTANDVAFTYQVIQNPDAKSTLNPSFRDITIKTIDPRTITFELPNALSAFPYSLTNGIVPKHILGGVTMTQLRSVSFNFTNPVGSGPFRWQTIETNNSDDPALREEQVGLLPNDNYHFGKPKLARFVIRSFRDEKKLITSFDKQELQAVVGLKVVPEQLKHDASVSEYSVPLTGGVFVFFKTSQEILKDPLVRRALILASDTGEIIKNLGYPMTTVKEPFLKNQLGYNSTLAQPNHNLEQANSLLDQAGFAKDPATGIRSKNKVPLSFNLTTQNTNEYEKVAKTLKKQWQEVGVDMRPVLLQEQDIQATLTDHNYDSLLYGISIGPDPDVFVYWHSSQFDLRSKTRLNFSEYRSDKADKALEGGRSRSDAALRAVKYKPFLEAWATDTPALALYQPRFLYLVHKPFFGELPKTMNTSTDRYSLVEQWKIREQKVDK